MSKAAIALLAVSLSGCTASYLLRPGDLLPVVARIPSDQRVVVWQRAITVLLDEGYVPQIMNEAACYISAKQRDDVTEGALAGTIAIVRIAPDGQLRVEVGGTGVYHDESELKRDIAEIQQRLLQEITSAPVAMR